MTTPFSMYQVGAEALLPPRDISVSQWADENVVLTGSGSAERGQWHTRPYQREPMDVLSPSHPCKQVVLMSAAQMLKTSVMVNFLGYIADVDPGPDAGGGAASGRRQGALQGSCRAAVPALAGAPREARRGEVARFEQHGDAQGVRQRLRAHHLHRRHLAVRPGHAADPVSVAGRGGQVSIERRIGGRSGIAGDAAHRGVRAQQEGHHVLDADRRRGEQNPSCVERERPARVLRTVPAMQSLPDPGLQRRHGGRACVAGRRAGEGRLLLREVPGTHPAQPEVVDGGARRVPSAESWVADSWVPRIADDLPEAFLGDDRRGVPGRQALDRDAQGVPEHRAGGTLGRTRVGAGLGKGLSAARGLRTRDRAGEGVAAGGWRRRAGRPTRGGDQGIRSG